MPIDRYLIKMSAYLCNLIVPGFPKCGTSSFHEYLAQCPEIYMSSPKEPQYFSVSKTWERGREFHNSLFSGAPVKCKYYGESSTTYCIYEPAIRRIKDCLDSPKIIAVLRDPVERVISHYNWLYALGLEKRPIMEAVEQSGHKFNPDNSIQGNYSAYLAFSAYSKYVPLWQKAFEEKNVLLIDSSSLKNEPTKTLDTVFEFLELPKVRELELVNKNATKNVQPISKRDWVRLARKVVPKPIKSIVVSNSLTANMWRHFTAQKKIIPPEINVADMEMLEKILEEDCRFYDGLFSC